MHSNLRWTRHSFIRLDIKGECNGATGVCIIEADNSNDRASIALFVIVLISMWVTVYTIDLTYFGLSSIAVLFTKERGFSVDKSQ